jgi:phenylpropionate dioxygenase-like ring-hydroxylating dioxygenase large terminal subunit
VIGVKYIKMISSSSSLVFMRIHSRSCADHNHKNKKQSVNWKTTSSFSQKNDTKTASTTSTTSGTTLLLLRSSSLKSLKSSLVQGQHKRLLKSSLKSSLLNVEDSAFDLATMKGGGGVDTNDNEELLFNWHKQWYPIAFECDLERDAPYAFTLLGIPLVFWRNNVNDKIQCVADICPHRLAPLSEGRINDKGEIECGYHGWTFEGDKGKCTSIPQLGTEGSALETALKSPRACATPYYCQIKQGLLWCYPTKVRDEVKIEDLPELPLIPEIDDPMCVYQDVFRDLPMDFSTLLENVMDVSHVPFTHHNSVGKRENATPVLLELTTVDKKVAKDGFTGEWKEGPRKGKYGTQFTEFKAPALMRHTLRTDSFTTLTVVYAVPISPGKCRLIARFPFIFKAALPRKLFGLFPTWYTHTNQNAILEDDQIFLHKQERLIEISRTVKNEKYAKACYMPSSADVYVNAFRNWIVDVANGGPSWPAGMSTKLPKQEETREALLDRYHAHTKNCKSCATALAKIVIFRKFLRVLSLVSLAVTTAFVAACLSSSTAWIQASVGSGLKPAYFCGVLSLLAAFVREKLGQLEKKMRVGPYPPPRRPPSMMEKALETAKLGGAFSM